VFKWIGTICCFGFTLIGLVSVWIRPLLGFRCGYISARHGNVLVTWSAAENAERDVFVSGLELIELPARFRFLWPYVRKVAVGWRGGTHLRWAVLLPLWLLFVIVAMPTLYLWWTERSFPPGHCQKCGYDLTGNVSGRCPECGTLVGSEKEAR